jgi:acyl-CoA synthetase (AMP-forming)/AMP-acid ligase II
MRHYIDDCAYFQPTVLSAVPTLLQFLLKYNALNPQLHTILVGAGDCSPDVLQAVQKSGRHISFGYGLTETSSGVAISIGEDPLAMSVCPDDTITLAEDGEILIYAPTCIMQGYYKDRAGTEEILQDSILHTGDIGMIDANGCLRIRGRKKEVLVFADGTKIYLPEYESRLAAALNNPETAVVMKGSRPMLVMQNNGMSRQDVMDAIGPVMKMYSRGRQIADVLFTDHPLPRTATGKIRRWQLQKEIGL